MTDERFDVIMIGAGLSGIGAARYLKTRLPHKSFAILETKPRMGGTWELFRYPGIRSDSDMHTMGYVFKPWKHPKAISEGPAIISYIEETAAENDLDRHIRYQHRVISAAWSSKDSLWTLEIEQADGGRSRMQASFIFSCAGYYNHDEAYLPEWPGYHDYQGHAGASAVLAEGSGLCGQAHRHRRLRRHGRDAGAVARRDGGACHPAAALADLCREPSVRRRVQHLPEALPAGAAGLLGDALAHHHRRPLARQAFRQGSEGREADAGRPGHSAGGSGLRPQALHAGLLAGPAADLPRTRRRHVQGDPREEGDDRHRPYRALRCHRHSAQERQAPRGRHHHHRDRPGAAVARRREILRSTIRRSSPAS